MVKWRIIAIFGLIFLCLISLSYVCFQSVEAEFQGDIVINSDGSIRPSTAPIQLVGNTYMLLDEIFGSSLVVQRGDIVIDGANNLLQGEKITGTGSYDTIGMNLTQVKNVTIRNFEFRDFGRGIALENSQNCILINNTLTNTNGIFLNASSNNQLIANSITPNIDSKFTQNIAVFVINSSYNNLIKNKISGNWWEGITVVGSNNIVSSNIVTECGLGIQVSGSFNVISSNVVFSTITATSKEIFANSGIGIGIGAGNGNQVFNNTVFNNGVGIGLNGSGSDIYLNSFINNTYQVQLFEESASATWDKDKVGNYWSDYQSKYPNASELDTSGIWDTPYAINKNNTDKYPLKEPVNLYEASNQTPTSTPFEPPRNPPHLDPTYYLIPLGIIISVVIVSTLLYRRHRKTSNLK